MKRLLCLVAACGLTIAMSVQAQALDIFPYHSQGSIPGSVWVHRTAARTAWDAADEAISDAWSAQAAFEYDVDMANMQMLSWKDEGFPGADGTVNSGEHSLIEPYWDDAYDSLQDLIALGNNPKHTSFATVVGWGDYWADYFIPDYHSAKTNWDTAKGYLYDLKYLYEPETASIEAMDYELYLYMEEKWEDYDDWINSQQ